MADGNQFDFQLKPNRTILKNQVHDEAFVVDEDTPSNLNSKPNKFQPIKLVGMASQETNNNSDDELDEAVVVKPMSGTAKAETVTPNPVETAESAVPGPSGKPEENNNSAEETEDDEEDDDDDDDTQAGHIEGAYDPSEFEHLVVSPEIKELFQYITRYTPQMIELEHKMKPFIPDFIPAVGDIDAFIKVTRPDGKPETLGLTVLDEPSAKQSDPTVLDLQLRAVSKQASSKSVVVKKLENAEKNPKDIDNWIKSISDLHKSKPPPTVHYSKPMPDIESLMQEWEPEFEELLKEVGLPSADTDCELGQYVDIVCGLLDIPIFKSKIQSLHVLFTLYSEFKNSQHFRQLAEENAMDNADKGDGVERLVIQ